MNGSLKIISKLAPKVTIAEMSKYFSGRAKAAPLKNMSFTQWLRILDVKSSYLSLINSNFIFM